MDRDELGAALQELCIDARAYDLSDAGKNETEIYVLRRRQAGVIGKPNYWVTFYSERGLETSRRDFPTESEACQYFLEWVSADLTTRGR